MFFLPLSLILLVVFILLLPVILFLLHMEIVGVALGKLGISPTTATLIFFASLIGSAINIPLTSRAVSSPAAGLSPLPYIGLPQLGNQQIIAINVGGAIIPLILCLWLLPKAPLARTLVATAIASLVMFKLARPVPAIGVQIPLFIPPLVAVTLGFIFSPRNPTPVAFISGVAGVLIGADLLNLGRLPTAGVMSIGGAGVYDGIFLVGIISALLSG